MEAVNALLEAWEPFFSAQLGAAAALGGLVFVGLSLNLAKILSFPTLPGRALLALVILVVILVVSSLMLVPGISASVRGVITLALGALVAIAGTVMHVRWLGADVPQSTSQKTLNLILFEAAMLPYVVAGLLLLIGSAASLYWLATGILISLVKAFLDAWVLLVEINR